MSVLGFQIIFFSFLAFYLIATFWSARKGTSLSDFYNMSGGAGALLIGGTYTGTLLSAMGVVGCVSNGFKFGPLTGTLNFVIPSYFVAMFIGLKLRRAKGHVTLGDFFGARYGSQGLRVLSTLVTIIALGAYFLTQIIGSAAITEALLGIPYNLMVVIMVCVFTIITLSSGSKSVTITDTIMTVLIVICLAIIFAPMVIGKVGLGAFAAKAAEGGGFFSATGEGNAVPWGSLLGIQIMWAFGNAVQPAGLSRCYLAKDSKTWIKGLLIATFAAITVAWLVVTAGSGVSLVNPDVAPNQALVWAAMNLVNPVIGAIAIAGLFAACLSTADTQQLTLAMSVSKDLYQDIACKGKEVPERKLLLVCRICIVVFGLLGMLFALGRSDLILAIGNFGGAIFGAAYAPAVLFGVMWKRYTKEGAITSMLSGTIVTTALYLAAVFQGLPFGTTTHLPFGLHPVIYGMIVSFLSGVIVSLFTRTSPEQEAFFDEINPPKEVLQTEAKSGTIKGALAAATAGVAVLLIVNILWANVLA